MDTALQNDSLVSLDDLQSTGHNATAREQSALPPTDRGTQAWLCLTGCFVANVMIWGFAFSFGVLQEYYTTHEPFVHNPANIPAIGTTTTGVGYLTMPVFFAVYRRWPKARLLSTWLSLPAAAAALIGASFANTVPHLIACQGLLFALAGNALIVPTIIYLDEWFVRRKGLAVGIMWAGDGTGGVIMPLVMHALLDAVGFRWTLRAIAALIVVSLAPLLFFLKPRLPISGTYAARPVNITFLKSPLFWTLQAFNVLQALGYFLPGNYLPSYARSIGLASSFSSNTLLIVNMASVFGCIGVGMLVDRFELTTVLLAISTLAGTAVLAIWALSLSIAPLFLFCLVYGISAGGYSTAWGGMVKEVQRKHAETDTSMLFGFLAAGRGIGAMISGPLSELLLNARHNSDMMGSSAYSGDYGSIIAFVGCTAIVGGGSWVVRRAGFI